MRLHKAAYNTRRLVAAANISRAAGREVLLILITSGVTKSVCDVAQASPEPRCAHPKCTGFCTFSGDVGIRMVFSSLEKGCWMLSNMLDSSTLVDLDN